MLTDHKLKFYIASKSFLSAFSLSARLQLSASNHKLWDFSSHHDIYSRDLNATRVEAGECSFTQVQIYTFFVLLKYYFTPGCVLGGFICLHRYLCKLIKASYIYHCHTHSYISQGETNRMQKPIKIGDDTILDQTDSSWYLCQVDKYEATKNRLDNCQH